MSKVFLFIYKIIIYIDSFFASYYNVFIQHLKKGRYYMKEKIYTIPINEAVDAGRECPFCIIAKKLEDETVDYTLGAAMMEPDYRVLCNEKGFCRHHYAMLFKKPNKLSLALILDTHMEEYRKRLVDAEKGIQKKGRGIFRKNDTAVPFAELSAESCVICEKIGATMERYAEVFFYMWKNDADFSKRIDESRGFCMEHFYFLAERAGKYLKNPSEFISAAYERQKKELDRMQENIHRFTLKFDYRNKDMEWGEAKDAPQKVIEKMSGYMEE